MASIACIHWVVPTGLSPMDWSKFWKPLFLSKSPYDTGFDRLVRNVDRSAKKQIKLNPPVRHKVRLIHYQILLWMTSVAVTTKPAGSTTSFTEAAIPNPLLITVGKLISGTK
jgi:hypothetical protein